MNMYVWKCVRVPAWLPVCLCNCIFNNKLRVCVCVCVCIFLCLAWLCCRINSMLQRIYSWPCPANNNAHTHTSTLSSPLSFPHTVDSRPQRLLASVGVWRCHKDIFHVRNVTFLEFVTLVCARQRTVWPKHATVIQHYEHNYSAHKSVLINAER